MKTKNMMRKLAAAVVIAVVSMSLAACGADMQIGDSAIEQEAWKNLEAMETKACLDNDFHPTFKEVKTLYTNDTLCVMRAVISLANSNEYGTRTVDFYYYGKDNSGFSIKYTDQTSFESWCEENRQNRQKKGEDFTDDDVCTSVAAIQRLLAEHSGVLKHF